MNRSAIQKKCSLLYLRLWGIELKDNDNDEDENKNDFVDKIEALVVNTDFEISDDFENLKALFIKNPEVFLSHSTPSIILKYWLLT